MNFLRSMNVPSHELDDFTQEIWIKVYEYRFKYQENAKFSTFLYLLAKQKVIDAARKNKKWSMFKERCLNFFEQTQAQTLRQTDLEKHQIESELLLQQLPHEQREVVILRTQAEMSYAEIAELMQLPLGTIKSRMHNALENMRKFNAK